MDVRRVLAAAVVAVTCLGLTAPQAMSAPPAAEITVGAAAEDYFTSVLGDPKDMSNPEDLTIVATGPMNGFVNPKIGGGVFSGVVRDSAYLSPVWSGYETGLFNPRDGLNYPSRIDQNKYNVFSAQIYSSRRIPAGIYWGQCSDGHLNSCAGGVPITLLAGWNLIRIPLGASKVGFATRAWTDAQVTGLRLSMNGLGVDTTVKIDWMRLTPDGQSASMSWANPSPGAWCDLIWDSDTTWTNNAYTAADHVPSASSVPTWGLLARTTAAGGTVDLGFLPPGTYHFSVRSYFADQSVREEAPYSTVDLDIPAPVVTSPDEDGNDADAPIVLDMSDPSQVIKTLNVGGISWADGKFTGTSVTNDAQVYFNIPPGIDPTVYDVAVIKWNYDGVYDLAERSGGGSMARLMWWSSDVGPQYMQTRDIITYTDQPTTIIDLAERNSPPMPRRINEESAGYKNPWARVNGPGMMPRTVTGLRFDPNEDLGPRAFHIDEVRLLKSFRTSSTGLDGLPTTANITWKDLSGADSDGSTVVVGLDTDRIGFNGIVVGEAVGGAGERSLPWSSLGAAPGNYWPWVAITRNGTTSRVYGRAPIVVTNDQPPPAPGIPTVTAPVTERMAGVGTLKVKWVPNPASNTTAWRVKFSADGLKWHSSTVQGPWVRMVGLTGIPEGAKLRVKVVPLAGTVEGPEGPTTVLTWTIGAPTVTTLTALRPVNGTVAIRIAGTDAGGFAVPTGIRRMQFAVGSLAAAAAPYVSRPGIKARSGQLIYARLSDAIGVWSPWKAVRVPA